MLNDKLADSNRFKGIKVGFVQVENNLGLETSGKQTQMGSYVSVK